MKPSVQAFVKECDVSKS